MQLSGPPKLKTTIIQLNKDIDPEDNNYEVLSKDYTSDSSKTASVSFSLGVSEEQPRKKRRRSSSTVGEEELAKRRAETKQLHSMIEKRRRIKINREFEALKYLIPACRTADNSSKKLSASNNNANKIDGMYKLTILKTAVEYILYLHHVVQKQNSLLTSSVDDYSFDVSFANIPLDVNQYRNIDQEFDFHELSSRCARQNSTESRRPTGMRKSLNSSSLSITETEEETASMSTRKTASDPEFFAWKPTNEKCNDKASTAEAVPEVSPIFTMLENEKKKGKGRSRLPCPKKPIARDSSNLIRAEPPAFPSNDAGFMNRSFLFTHQSRHSGVASGTSSTSTSPFTMPLNSLVKKSVFTLPDPALTSTSTSCSLMSKECASVCDSTMKPSQAYPRRMFFKSQVPPQNLVTHVGTAAGALDLDILEVDKLENASQVLLALRKPSIGQLLN